jgi:hypothetical protein
MDLLLLRLFPADLSRLIRGFVIRPDWQTCRAHESQLIKDFNRWTKRVLDDDALDWYDTNLRMEFPILFNQKELDIYLKEWTLFGRWYLILRTRKDYYWHSYAPTHNIDVYTDWYAWTFYKIHNHWRNHYLDKKGPIAYLDP